MPIPNHDKVGEGFSVEPEQLAHDLTLLMLSKSEELTKQSSEWDYYDAYVKTLQKVTDVIEEKTRYDSSFKK